MFGPGLESSTSGIVRKMLYEDNPHFARIAMFPGQFDGVGAGMTLKLTSGYSFHLSVLYSNSKRERENADGQNRLARNRLLNKQQTSGDGEEQPTYELNPSIRDLCHAMDAFVFVVDASESRDSVCAAKSELFAMVSERWSAPHVPVLVLSCIGDSTATRLPAIDIVRALDLTSLNRPWQVRDCIVESLIAVDTSFEWVVQQTQHH